MSVLLKPATNSRKHALTGQRLYSVLQEQSSQEKKDSQNHYWSVITNNPVESFGGEAGHLISGQRVSCAAPSNIISYYFPLRSPRPSTATYNFSKVVPKQIPPARRRVEVYLKPFDNKFASLCTSAFLAKPIFRKSANRWIRFRRREKRRRRTRRRTRRRWMWRWSF